MTHLRTLAVGMGVCVAIAMIACGNGNPNPSGTSTGGGGACPGKAAVSSLGTPTMTIAATDTLVFDPASSNAQVGDIIEFKNTGSVEHTVTFQDSNDGCLTDNTLDPGATWEVSFTKPGKYNYLCTIHAPNMKGVLTIGGSAAQPSSSASGSPSPAGVASPPPSPSATASP